MQIFFIYDTDYCKSDEDDPKNAVIFFYPLETCETQRCTLCCQLVGIAQFLKGTFSSLSSIILDHGRFVFHQWRNFLFVLGGNYDIECIVLKKHLNYLCETFSFYYGDITTIIESCVDRQSFLDKMKLIWIDFLKASRSNDCLSKISFATMPFCVVNQNSSICRKASQLLQMCQLNSAVIAGAVFCSNFMLSTQLTPELTSYLSLLSYSSFSSSCEDSSVEDLPPGVELKYVYLPKEQLEKVMNFNHKNVGNVIRVQNKDRSNRNTSSNCDNLNSGSEADIDSENCSETVQKKHEPRIHSDPSVIPRIDKGSYSNPCVVDMSKTFNLYHKKRSISDSEVQNLRRKSNDVSDTVKEQNVYRKMKSKSHKLSETLHQFKRKPSLSDSSNLICGNHALYRASLFTLDSTVDFHSVFDKSSCDFEYSCYLCKNTFKQNSFFRHQILKHWNSDIFLSQFPDQKKSEFHILTQKLCFSNLISTCAPIQSISKKGKKIQILKCRYTNESVKVTARRQNTDKTFRKHLPNQSQNFTNVKTFSQFPTSKKNHGPVIAQSLNNSQSSGKLKKPADEEKHLQKVLLLNQQCGNSNLVLLLNSTCDKKVINYVWNCGFSSLKDLELAVKKNILDEEKTESNYRIFLYDALRKTLTNYPKILNLLLMEKYDHDSLLLKIHQDFLSSRSLSSICVLTSNKSIFAQQYKNHHLMYLQKEGPSRKLGSLSSLILKAAYRFTKGFNTVLKH